MQEKRADVLLMDRPKCGDKVPDTGKDLELLQKLLTIELGRLDVAVRIEKERNIVFPETTVIIRDVLKLQQAIAGGNGRKSIAGGIDTSNWPDMETMPGIEA